jgi:hypothetical protein
MEQSTEVAYTEDLVTTAASLFSEQRELQVV